MWLRLHAISVSLDRGGALEDADPASFEMTITMDAAAEAISSTWRDKEVRAAGCALSVKYEDETYYISFRLAGPGEDPVREEAKI